jgi:hypothetical protein
MEHMPVVKKYFRLRTERPRVLDIKTGKGAPAIDSSMRRLSGADIGKINRLYRTQGPGKWLRGYRRELVDRGYWYGYFEDGRLVSVTGTQAFSPTYGVDFGGYTLTHPKYRNRGYATLLRNVRLHKTLESCPLVVNTIDRENKASWRFTEKIGTEFLRDVIDTPAFRRDPLGLTSLLKRIEARGLAKEYSKKQPKFS